MSYIYITLKKYFLIFLITPFVFFSQEKNNAFNLLLTAGLSPSQIHGDAFNGFHKLGAIGGIGVESVFSDKFRSSLSFLFIQKGARRNPNPEKGDYEAYYLNLNYIEVPLLFTYTQKKYLFDIGISTAYLINYYESTQNGNVTGFYPFKKFEYALKIGLGYNITENVYMNFRSSNSFITIRPNSTKQAIYYNNILARMFNRGYYNNILEITVGYRIKTKK